MMIYFRKHADIQSAGLISVDSLTPIEPHFLDQVNIDTLCIFLFIFVIKNLFLTMNVVIHLIRVQFVFLIGECQLQ